MGNGVKIAPKTSVYAVEISRDAFHDWSKQATVRKIVCALALFMGLLAALPSSVPSQVVTPAPQTADEARIYDSERRISLLETLPEREAMLEADMRDIKEEVDGLNTRAWLILVAALAALLDRFLGAFGIRIKGGAN